MNALLFLVLVVVALGILAILIIATVWMMAKNDWYATLLPESTMAFVISGGTLVKTLVNIKGMHLEGSSEEIDSTSLGNQKQVYRRLVEGDDPNENRLQRWLRKKYGFFFFSAKWPLHKIHKFKISKSRLRKKGEVGPEAKLRDWVEYDPEDSQVKGLRWRFPRYFVIEDIDFQDRIRGVFLVFTNWEIIFPYLPVFVYQGKFFDLLESAVRGKIIDWAKEMPYEEFIMTNKGPNSEFAKSLPKINNHDDDEEEGEDKGEGKGTIPEFGIKLIDGWIIEANVSDKDERAQQALQAQEVNRLQGEARIIEAGFEAEAIRRVGRAEASVITAKGTASENSINRRFGAAAKHGGKSAIRAVAIETASDNLRNAGLRTLAIGGQSPITNIPLEGDIPLAGDEDEGEDRVGSKSKTAKPKKS